MREEKLDLLFGLCVLLSQPSRARRFDAEEWLCFVVFIDSKSSVFSSFIYHYDPVFQSVHRFTYLSRIPHSRFHSCSERSIYFKPFDTMNN